LRDAEAKAEALNKIDQDYEKAKFAKDSDGRGNKGAYDVGTQVKRARMGMLIDGGEDANWDKEPFLERAVKLNFGDEIRVNIDCLGALYLLEVPEEPECGFQISLNEESIEEANSEEKEAEEAIFRDLDAIMGYSSRPVQESQQSLKQAFAAISVTKGKVSKPTEADFLGGTLSTGMFTVTLDPARAPSAPGKWYLHVMACGQGAISCKLRVEEVFTMAQLTAQVEVSMDIAEAGMAERDKIAARAEVFQQQLVKAAEENRMREEAAHVRMLHEKRRLAKLQKEMKRRGKEHLKMMIANRRFKH